MIDNATVGFLRHPLVETAITRLHMKNRDFAFFRRDGGQRAVGITQDQEGIGSQCIDQCIDFYQDIADGCSRRITDSIQKMIGATYAQFQKKYFV